jgi:hypothetical protein
MERKTMNQRLQKTLAALLETYGPADFWEAMLELISDQQVDAAVESMLQREVAEPDSRRKLIELILEAEYGAAR